MLKERKAQGRDPTSHLQEKEVLPVHKKVLLNNLITRKQEAMKVMKLFVLMHSITLLVNYHLSYNLTQFAICEEEAKQEQHFLLQRCQVVG